LARKLHLYSNVAFSVIIVPGITQKNCNRAQGLGTTQWWSARKRESVAHAE
jgi:hypothetical protein